MSFRNDELILIDPLPSDIEIAQGVKPIPISQIVENLNLFPEEYDLYGRTKAKISCKVLERFRNRENAKYVVVTGITPTPLGEGKTTTTLGLSQAFGKHLNKPVFTCIRQPSLGPTFGIKGGAAGGGYSQVIPMEEFNLHLTGDIHAISLANNLLAAAINTRMLHEKSQSDNSLFERLVPKNYKGSMRYYSDPLRRRAKRLKIDLDADPELRDLISRRKLVRLDIDENSIMINRVVDVNDRFLRGITIGQNPSENFPLQTSFDISVGSEIMAILALSVSLEDLKNRLQKMVCCLNKEGEILTADDFGIVGAMTVLLIEAIKPTLMQSLEGTPVFVHAGPFANIAHGNSSIIADLIASKLVSEEGYVITEAGFGSDIGLEKFCNIKCRYSGLKPNAIVLVATVRALKLHGGGPPVIAGAVLPEAYKIENLDLVNKGCLNLSAHIKSSLTYGIPVVVCVNSTTDDSLAELNLVCEKALEAGAFAACISTHWSKGGQGAVNLAKAVQRVCELDSTFQFLYPLKIPLKDKIGLICKTIYGADGVEYTPKAESQLSRYMDLGFSEFVVCMAKTQYSLSHDPNLKGVPSGFVVPIKEARLFGGAGFITLMCGPIMTMPGLPTRPSFYDIDVDPHTGKISGLF